VLELAHFLRGENIHFYFAVRGNRAAELRGAATGSSIPTSPGAESWTAGTRSSRRCSDLILGLISDGQGWGEAMSSNGGEKSLRTADHTGITNALLPRLKWTST
jgi:hypothetical protein